MKHRFPIIVLFLVIIVLQSFLIGANPAEFPDDEFLKVAILFTNDIHGGIARTEAGFINPDFPPILGNGAAAVYYINGVREEAKENGWGFLLFDAGDIFQGTPVGTLSKGEAIIDFMNIAGYDAVCIGNHDFDLGWQNLKKLSEQANFPLLGANIYHYSTGEIVKFATPYIIKEIQGIKIGIIGVCTTVTPSLSFPEHIKDIDFRAEVPTIRYWLPKMRAEGAQIIIMVNHTWLPYDPEKGYLEMLEKIKNGDDFTGEGVNSQEIAHAIPGIDIIFSGHIHKGFNDPWEEPDNHTLIFQNYANGTNLGHVNFFIHRKTGTLAGYNYVCDGSAIFTLFEDDFFSDTTTARVIENWVKKAEVGFDEIIGVAKGNFMRSNEGESAIGNLVTDATRIRVNADIAFTNYGGIRADLSAGHIMPRNLFTVMPFGNRIVVFNVTGKFIKSLIEDKVKGNSRGMLVSGCKIVIDRSRPDGNRVKEFFINGESINEEKIYRLAVSDYLAEGNSGYGRLTEVPIEKINYTGILIRQALIDYVKRNSPIAPHIDGRWQERD